MPAYMLRASECGRAQLAISARTRRVDVEEDERKWTYGTFVISSHLYSVSAVVEGIRE